MEWTKLILGWAGIFALGGLLYWLYINGYLTVSAKSAVAFVGSMRAGQNLCEAVFTSCSGYVMRIVRFRESRDYQFFLAGQTDRGSVIVEVQNRAKLPVLLLDADHRCGTLHPDCKQRYYLVVRFHAASGNFRLQWQ